MPPIKSIWCRHFPSYFLLNVYTFENVDSSSIFFQFNSVYLYGPISQITNLSRSALQSVHIDIPVPKPHIGSGKTPK